MNPRYIIGIVFIALGISALTGFDLGRYIGPLFLIAIGLMIISGRNRRWEGCGETSPLEQDTINEVLIFSGAKRNIHSLDFNGGKITAVFGGAEFDFSSVKTKKKIANMELVAVFGGVKIKVPQNWVVTSEAVGILGGVDNHTRSKEKTAELHLTGAAIFGGIEITN